MTAQAWLTWWHSGYWRAAHDSWRQDAWFALSPSQQQRLTRLHAGTIGRQWGIDPAPLPAPQPLLLTIASLDEAEKRDCCCWSPPSAARKPRCPATIKSGADGWRKGCARKAGCRKTSLRHRHRR
ncbi:hypothetical protein HA40_19020 [Mixta calida]|nr:hypothetical protein HA40_19020 [Mixta calida]